MTQPRHAAPVQYPEPLYPPGFEEPFGSAVIFAEQQLAVDNLLVEYWAQQGNGQEAAVAYGRSREHDANLATSLLAARAAIRGAQALDHGLIEDYIGLHVGPAQYKHLGHVTFAEWLADPHRGATDDEVLDFFRWHGETVAKQQPNESPKVRHAFEQEQDRYIDGVTQAVWDGHFSTYALMRLDKVRNIRLVVGDLWHTAFANKHGYHWLGSDYVVIRQGSRHDGTTTLEDDAVGRIRDVASHEFDHPAFGRWEERWFREGMAQHNTLSIRDGRFHAMSPSDRPDDTWNDRYRNERELIALLLQGPNATISTRYATRAHTGAGPTSVEWTEFMHQLDTAWGYKDVYAKVSKHLHELEASYQAQYPTASEAAIQNQAVVDVVNEFRAYKTRAQQAAGRAKVSVP